MQFASKQSGLTTWALVFLITGAVDSIRNLPATALFGSSLIFFFIFSAIVFLIPVALVSAELSANYPENGGVYHWVGQAFGEKIGFFTVWLQWINTMVWFPTILSFIVSTAAYYLDPALAQNKIYLVGSILFIFWVMTLLNFKGIQASTRLANTCAILGVFIPMILIILLSLIWLIKGNPIQIELTMSAILPPFHSVSSWISLTAIMTAFLGIELSTVHINDVYQPQSTFPKAMFISVAVILVTMIMGSLAIAFVLPKDDINLVAGVMQAFTAFFASYHIAWIMPIITLMLLIGSIGNMTSWIISPARGLLQAAQEGYLPKKLMKQNDKGVATNLLIAQAVAVSVMCLVFTCMPSVNGSYWLLSALSTQLYVLMYVLMFAAAIVLKTKHPTTKTQTFRIPYGRIGHFIVCCLGLLGCGITLFVGFIPPEGISVGTPLHYELFFCGGLLAMMLPVGLFYMYKNNVALAMSEV